MQDAIFKAIYELSETYALTLRQKIDDRILEMQGDDNSHYLLYRVLGVSTSEGKLIDEYQNTGRFLYKYAGSFLEEAAIKCFEISNHDARRKVKIPNTRGVKPKTFEIDCLIERVAIEIKWRDATTDGDHITKEHTRVQTINDAGYKPVRIMFYYPNRSQAIRIQETLASIYKSVGGEYYFSEGAWDYIRNETGIDLLCILEKIADMRESQ